MNEDLRRTHLDGDIWPLGNSNRYVVCDPDGTIRSDVTLTLEEKDRLVELWQEPGRRSVRLSEVRPATAKRVSALDLRYTHDIPFDAEGGFRSLMEHYANQRIERYVERDYGLSSAALERSLDLYIGVVVGQTDRELPVLEGPLSFVLEPRTKLEPETISPELEAMISCIRTSAQETLDALRRAGWELRRR